MPAADRATDTDPARARRYGAWPLVALACTVGLETGERLSLSHAVEGIKAEFGVTDAALGWLAFAMVVVGVVGAFPMGALTDRVRHRTWLLAGAVAIWVLVMGLNGLATSFTLLFLARLGVGAVEATGPAAVSLLADYYPVEDRARRMGLYQSGAFAGAMLGLLLGGVAVGLGGWRWAFLIWVPLGIPVVVLLLRQPEPFRGQQDADFEIGVAVASETVAAGGLPAALAMLPPPSRTARVDYSACSAPDALREIARIPSMWFGVLSLTVGQLLLTALQFWGVEYFKRVHGLSERQAGAVAALLGVGSVVGILGGGFVADRYLRRGHVNARVYVTAAGSVAASLVLLPAFASTSLAVTAPLFFLGGIFLTVPVAPSEALVSDVVVPGLRGRAATLRSVVRALSALGPLLVGTLSLRLGDDADSLRLALVAITPLYAVGGVLMLRAARHYPVDLAFVVSESARARREAPPQTGLET